MNGGLTQGSGRRWSWRRPNWDAAGMRTRYSTRRTATIQGSGSVDPPRPPAKVAEAFCGLPRAGGRHELPPCPALGPWLQPSLASPSLPSLPVGLVGKSPLWLLTSAHELSRPDRGGDRVVERHRPGDRPGAGRRGRGLPGPCPAKPRQGRGGGGRDSIARRRVDVVLADLADPAAHERLVSRPGSGAARSTSGSTTPAPTCSRANRPAGPSSASWNSCGGSTCWRRSAWRGWRASG